MATVAYNVGHGWSTISNVRGGWGEGGNGINPKPSWNTPSAQSEPINRPQVGDEIDFTFSSPKFTQRALNEIGLSLDDNNIVVQAAG